MFREKYSKRWKSEREKRKKFCHRYNIIPEKFLKSPIFEFGSGEGIRQVECKHKKFFLESDYLGIDLLEHIRPELNIIQEDILQFKTNRKFTTILSIGTLEHIPLDKWSFVVDKLKNLCVKKGNIVIFVPYKESVNQYMNGVEDHLVFGITKEFMLHFFPEAKVKIIYEEMLRQHGESLIWAIGRWFKRLMMLDLKIFKIIPRRVGLLVIWENT